MGQGPQVLVVNRDPHLLALIARFLASDGCNAVTTWAHAHALRWIECRRFDVVIDDYGGLPLRSVRFLRTVHLKQAGAVCIVVHEAALEPNEVNELRAMGVHAVISRWNLKDLVQTVRALNAKKDQPAASSESNQTRPIAPGRAS